MLKNPKNTYLNVPAKRWRVCHLQINVSLLSPRQRRRATFADISINCMCGSQKLVLNLLEDPSPAYPVDLWEERLDKIDGF